MFRTALIILAILLGIGAMVLVRQIPAEINMKGPVKVLIGLGLFFGLFFATVRIIDGYFWWMLPVGGFIGAFISGTWKLGDINRLARRGQWSTETLTSRPGTGAALVPTPMTAEELQAALDAFDAYDREYDKKYLEPRQRSFLDDFLIADEADLGPNELDLEHLDDFIFTSRHGYLVHDHDPDRAPCDVMTISPGMSITDLIEAAKQHECVKETA
jgi:hypothetical protein